MVGRQGGRQALIPTERQTDRQTDEQPHEWDSYGGLLVAIFQFIILFLS